ncbi:hypothetical protein AGDE_17183 [Angomonas deanei]|uniref:Uncharacterized protein n=1 Tax=Angomonas deanei TaxID=59799 RepID=A0A7G2CN32_9TRYP|nr:hypothetical protein AGDE_17183 [Angomonas deanei]CAD2221246.1 hypothetical protein, conserved [Angomonas deanei]|eukprot:EPY15089.1 hypothetical protein AGDE_17183 [Angomonas deanei]
MGGRKATSPLSAAWGTKNNPRGHGEKHPDHSKASTKKKADIGLSRNGKKETEGRADGISSALFSFTSPGGKIMFFPKLPTSSFGLLEGKGFPDDPFWHPPAPKAPRPKGRIRVGRF